MDAITAMAITAVRPAETPAEQQKRQQAGEATGEHTGDTAEAGDASNVELPRVPQSVRPDPPDGQQRDHREHQPFECDRPGHVSVHDFVDLIDERLVRARDELRGVLDAAQLGPANP